MYTSFARVYDALMDTVDYAAWAEHYKQLMEACHVPAKGRCVECACGTGSLTLPLRKMGYQMTGVDVSEEMLAAAMEKARAVLIRLFGGYTIQEAHGGWIGDDGMEYQEYTLVIYLSDTTEDQVHAAADELISLFNQSSVMIQANPTKTEFYSAD